MYEYAGFCHPDIFSPSPTRGRTETTYEADVGGELAADSETEPKDLTEVDVVLGWGQITCGLDRR